MIGYRNWDFDKAAGCLVGTYGAEWHGKMVKADQEPSRDNQSGIYARKYLSPDVAYGVYGAVDLSGKILVHSDDVIRAQYSTILWLTYDRSDLDDDEDFYQTQLLHLRQFCKDKDIVFLENKYIKEIEKKISVDLSTALLNNFNEDTLTVPAMDGMFSVLSHRHPLDYGTYAKVKFQILKDSLDYQILDKLSNRASIPYSILLESFNSHKNYFLAIFRRIECEESFYRIQKFVGHFDDGDTVYVFINDKGLEILDHIKHHCYYSYNTKDARFVYRRKHHVRDIFAYKTTNGKYKILYNGKVSEELSSFEDVMELCRGDSFSFLCDYPIVEKEIDDIGGYYGLHSYYGGAYRVSRVNYTYYYKDEDGEYPSEMF
jgi:hypothetical protein